MTAPTEKSHACGHGGCGHENENPQMQQDQNIQDSLSKIKHKLIVMSGKGGVGKSSLSANIATTLSQKGFKTGLLDVDIHGPSIAGMMGIEGLLDISEDRKVIPKKANENLGVVSMQSLMNEKDQAVIWRGPAKTGIIRQFVGDVLWGEIDFLIVDAPPGTGDEPLSVAQTVPDARSLIITTPQEVALSDVRKSINFCRTVNMDILGLIENMGPFDCPCCGKKIALFKSDGGRLTAENMGVDFLGSLPFDPEVVKACDNGTPIAQLKSGNGFVKALDGVVKEIVGKL